VMGCGPTSQSGNCPTPLGPDFDFGATPVLMTLKGGKQVLVAGQKSGVVYGLDARTGALIWKTQLGVGSALGGVEWGIGADYLIEGFLPLLQLNQVIFTDDGPEQLLSNPETRLLASVRKRFLAETLEVELRGVYAFERAAWFTYPRISYRWKDNWRFRLGYLAIGGPLESMIGQFHANDEFTLEVRYSF